MYSHLKPRTSSYRSPNITTEPKVTYPTLGSVDAEEFDLPGGPTGRQSGRQSEAPTPVTNYPSELYENWLARQAKEGSETGAGAEFVNDFVGGWRRRIVESLEDGDIEGMKQEAALMAQLRTIEIGMESSDEKVALDANKFLLSQAGHGPIAKVEHSMKYEGLPEDQLAAMVMSKLKRIGMHKPALLVAARAVLADRGDEELPAEEKTEIIKVEAVAETIDDADLKA